jgi:hypothetical protein
MVERLSEIPIDIGFGHLVTLCKVLARVNSDLRVCTYLEAEYPGLGTGLSKHDPSTSPNGFGISSLLFLHTANVVIPRIRQLFPLTIGSFTRNRTSPRIM